jgi:hypothetical protein
MIGTRLYRPWLLTIAISLLAWFQVAIPAAAQAPWYEHYQRGLDLAGQGSWEAALRELEAAARSEPRPRRRVVTTGRNVIIDYDPHYHIARCLTELGRQPAAILQLRAAYRAGVTPRPQLDALRARLEQEIAARPIPSRTALPPATPLPTATAPPRHPPARPTATATAALPGATTTPSPAAVPAAAAPAPVPSPPSPPPVEADRSVWRRAAAWAGALVVLMLGLAWLIVSRRRASLDPGQTPTRIVAGAGSPVDDGTVLGPYRLVGLLGRGGMATTYRATRTLDGTPVAIKVPHESCLADPTFLTRFLREGRLGEQLHHPRIVRILEAGEHGGRPFLAMELLAGRTLKQELRERGPLEPRRALEIAADIAEALDYAHVKGVVHRDLKPENVMVLPDGSIKVMDFGIARLEGQEGLTSSQLFLGTPLYAAPEMIEPKGIDHRVDLYSLGIILFEMLEGTVPFTADSPFKVLQMHQRDPLPERAALAQPMPARVWRIVERLCAKRPADRYASAEVLLVELHTVLRDFTTLGGNRG